MASCVDMPGREVAYIWQTKKGKGKDKEAGQSKEVEGLEDGEENGNIENTTELDMLSIVSDDDQDEEDGDTYTNQLTDYNYTLPIDSNIKNQDMIKAVSNDIEAQKMNTTHEVKNTGTVFADVQEDIEKAQDDEFDDYLKICSTEKINKSKKVTVNTSDADKNEKGPTPVAVSKRYEINKQMNCITRGETNLGNTEIRSANQAIQEAVQN